MKKSILFVAAIAASSLLNAQMQIIGDCTDLSGRCIYYVRTGITRLNSYDRWVNGRIFADSQVGIAN